MVSSGALVLLTLWQAVASTGRDRTGRASQPREMDIDEER